MKIPNDRLPSRGKPNKDPAKGQYAGTYSGDGKSLKRTSDGLHLLILDRAQPTGPQSSRFYLILASSPTRDYVSNVYGDEFDDRIYRYQIVARPDEVGIYDIVVLYRLTGRRSGRRATNV